MRYCIQRSSILQLALNFLKRDDLRWRRGSDGKYLPQQSRSSHSRKRNDVATDGRLQDGVPDVTQPPGRVLPKRVGAWIRAHSDHKVGRLHRFKLIDVSERRRRPVRQRDSFKAPGKRLAPCGSKLQRRGSTHDNMHRGLQALKAVPNSLEMNRPVCQLLRVS